MSTVSEHSTAREPVSTTGADGCYALRGDRDELGLLLAEIERQQTLKRNAQAREIASQKIVLSIGDDEVLLRTRQMLLESAGYRVRSGSSNRILEDGEALSIDLAVFCHTLTASRMVAIRDSLRKLNPHLPVLELGTFTGLGNDGFNHGLAQEYRPANLLKTVEQMLSEAQPFWVRCKH